MGLLSKLFAGTKRRDPEVDSAISVLRGKTVVAVETSPIVLRVLGLAMSEAGANFLAFSSTPELLSGASSSKPHVALLNAGDLGYDTASIVKQIKSEFPGIRVVLLTDLARNLEPAAASLLGADAVHRKPFDAGKLLDSIARLLR